MTRHERRSGKVEGSGLRWVTCEPCGKRGYIRKDEAKKMARVIGEVRTYPCPVVRFGEHRLYHVGHLPHRIIAGEVDRGTVYGDRS